MRLTGNALVTNSISISTASAMIRVIAGFVASGYPLQCEELDQIYE